MDSQQANHIDTPLNVDVTTALDLPTSPTAAKTLPATPGLNRPTSWLLTRDVANRSALGAKFFTRVAAKLNVGKKTDDSDVNMEWILCDISRERISSPIMLLPVSPCQEVQNYLNAATLDDALRYDGNMSYHAVARGLASPATSRRSKASPLDKRDEVVLAISKFGGPMYSGPLRHTPHLDLDHPDANRIWCGPTDVGEFYGPLDAFIKPLTYIDPWRTEPTLEDLPRCSYSCCLPCQPSEPVTAQDVEEHMINDRKTTNRERVLNAGLVAYVRRRRTLPISSPTDSSACNTPTGSTPLLTTSADFASIAGDSFSPSSQESEDHGMPSSVDLIAEDATFSVQLYCPNHPSIPSDTERLSTDIETIATGTVTTEAIVTVDLATQTVDIGSIDAETTTEVRVQPYSPSHPSIPSDIQQSSTDAEAVTPEAIASPNHQSIPSDTEQSSTNTEAVTSEAVATENVAIVVDLATRTMETYAIDTETSTTEVISTMVAATEISDTRLITTDSVAQDVTPNEAVLPYHSDSTDSYLGFSIAPKTTTPYHLSGGWQPDVPSAQDLHITLDIDANPVATYHEFEHLQRRRPIHMETTSVAEPSIRQELPSGAEYDDPLCEANIARIMEKMEAMERRMEELREDIDELKEGQESMEELLCEKLS
jgi:hypothetical protein